MGIGREISKPGTFAAGMDGLGDLHPVGEVCPENQVMVLDFGAAPALARAAVNLTY